MCQICNGLPDCPVCSEETPQEKCDCDYGIVYVSAELGEVDFEVYDKLTEDQRWTEDCEKCEGSGYVSCLT